MSGLPTEGRHRVNTREEIPITEEVMRYAKVHMDKVRPWSHGGVSKAYREKDGRISITYEDACWWFYRDVGQEVIWE
mgnify:CR=1 FL=1